MASEDGGGGAEEGGGGALEGFKVKKPFKFIKGSSMFIVLRHKIQTLV